MWQTAPQEPSNECVAHLGFQKQKQCLKYTYENICVGCFPISFFRQSRLHSHMKGHVRSVENRSWTWRNCSLQMGDKEECQTCLVHVDVCLLACLKVCLDFLCRIPAPSISCVFLFEQHIGLHMGELDGPTYRLMSRVSIPLLAPCYFNETDSGTVKTLLFVSFFFTYFFISLSLLLFLNMLAHAPSCPVPNISCHPSLVCTADRLPNRSCLSVLCHEFNLWNSMSGTIYRATYCCFLISLVKRIYVFIFISRTLRVHDTPLI